MFCCSLKQTNKNLISKSWDSRNSCTCFIFFLYQSELDENQIQMAGDDVGLPEDLQKMVAEDQVEEEDKDSILGQLQNIQNMDMDAIKEKAQATFTEMKQAAEQKCSVM